MTLVGIAGPDLTTRYFSPLTENFANKGTAPLGIADTGQSWWVTDSGQANAAFSIINGKLANSANTAVLTVAYATANLGVPIVRIGCTFTLAAGTSAGVAAIVIWKSLLLDAYTIPDSPCHLTISPTDWNFGTWTNHVLTSKGNGALSLTANDTTVYTVDVTIVGNQATLVLPGISNQVITDASIGANAGNFICFESYQANGATNARPKFVTVWGNT